MNRLSHCKNYPGECLICIFYYLKNDNSKNVFWGLVKCMRVKTADLYRVSQESGTILYKLAQLHCRYIRHTVKIDLKQFSIVILLFKCNMRDRSLMNMLVMCIKCAVTIVLMYVVTARYSKIKTVQGITLIAISKDFLDNTI